MSRNGSGVYSLPIGNPFVTLTAISSSVMNATMSDIATELTNSIDKGGRTAPTANLPMAGFKHTGAGAALASGQYLVYGQTNASLINLSTQKVAIDSGGMVGYNLTDTITVDSFVVPQYGLAIGDFAATSGTGKGLWLSGYAEVRIANQGATVLRITSGNLTTLTGTLSVSGPVLSGGSCTSVQDGGTQTRTGSFAIMNGFTTEHVDVGNRFNAADTYIAPITGIYEVSFSSVIVGDGGAVSGEIAIYKNGSAAAISQQGTSSGTADLVAISQTVYLSLTAADTIALYARRINGSVNCLFTHTVLNIRQVQ